MAFWSFLIFSTELYTPDTLTFEAFPKTQITRPPVYCLWDKGIVDFYCNKKTSLCFPPDTTWPHLGGFDYSWLSIEAIARLHSALTGNNFCIEKKPFKHSAILM